MKANSLEVKIKTKLLEKNIKQAEIATTLGYSRPYISRLIRGKENSPKFNQWVKQNLGIAV